MANFADPVLMLPLSSPTPDSRSHGMLRPQPHTSSLPLALASALPRAPNLFTCHP